MKNIAYAVTSANDVAGETSSELANIIEKILTKVPLWIAAIAIIIFSIILAKIARRIVENKLAEKGIEEEHQELQILMGRVVNSGIQVLGITAALKIAGIDLTTILAAVAFGIGFALKDLIMNFLAGIMILVSRHFVIGDFIKIGATLGKVVEIQSRVTILQATDGTKVIVPNAELFKKQVISFTSNPFRRLEIIVNIDYRNSLDNALRICDHILKNTKGVLVEPKPGVLIGDFGDNGISIKVRAWVNAKGGWLKIKSKLVQKIKTKFDEHGIRIPWPMKVVVNDKDQEIVEKIMEEEKLETPATEQVAPVTPATVPVAAEAQTATPEQAVPDPAQTTETPPQTPPEDQPLKPLGEKK
ncbi:mechanosensitive ion channel family protein [Patescibacteria group bacterium]